MDIEQNPSDEFNIVNIHKHFRDCLDNDLTLEAYLLGYEELSKIFANLGTAFTFVINDVKLKIELIRALVTRHDKKHAPYENVFTVLQLITHEQQNNLFDREHKNGSRNLLRLHRALDFLRQFLREVSRLDANATLTEPCRVCYNNTLALHHTWLIRTGVSLAVKLLPTKRNLLNDLYKSSDRDAKQTELLAQLPDTLAVIDELFDKVQRIYDEHQLNDLP